jgi:hypothetical protein
MTKKKRSEDIGGHIQGIRLMMVADCVPMRALLTRWETLVFLVLALALALALVLYPRGNL